MITKYAQEANMLAENKTSSYNKDISSNCKKDKIKEDVSNIIARDSNQSDETIDDHLFLLNQIAEKASAKKDKFLKRKKFAENTLNSSGSDNKCNEAVKIYIKILLIIFYFFKS